MEKPSREELVRALEHAIAALEAGETPGSNADDAALLHKAFFCFSEEALADDPDITTSDLANILAVLCGDDIPTFKAALDAVANGRQAWLGFKVVTDASLALDSTDSSAWDFNGPGQGSADVMPGVFFATEDKQIVFGREFSPRDRRQMLDITRGPHMHNRQYAGVAWTSMPLEPQGRVVMLGAGDVSVELEKVALQCDFDTVAVDYDVEYLNAQRFPASKRVLVPSFSELAALDALGINESDFLCVLTRGHMFDTEAIVWAVGTSAAYIGMMGNPMKNERVFELAAATGVAPEAFTAERICAPIGFKMGGKTPAELAVSIVMQLIQVRAARRQA